MASTRGFCIYEGRGFAKKPRQEGVQGACGLAEAWGEGRCRTQSAVFWTHRMQGADEREWQKAGNFFSREE